MYFLRSNTSGWCHSAASRRSVLTAVIGVVCCAILVDSASAGLFSKRKERKAAAAAAAAEAQKYRPAPGYIAPPSPPPQSVSSGPFRYTDRVTPPRPAPRPDRSVPAAAITPLPAVEPPVPNPIFRPTIPETPETIPSGVDAMQSSLPGYPRQESIPQAPVPAPLPMAPTTTLPPTQPEPPQVGRKNQSRPLRVFVLGDSQSLFPFGEELQKALVSAGCEVYYDAVKNGTPYYWQGKWPSPVLTRLYEPARTLEDCGRWEEVSQLPRSIDDYVQTYDPDVFLFQAGTNFEEDLAGSSTQGIVKLIHHSLNQATARGAKVLWIGPPDARDDVRSPEDQMRAIATLRSALSTVAADQGGLCFLDSRSLCPMPNDASGDGEHPSFSVGRKWGADAGLWATEAITQWKAERTLRPSALGLDTESAGVFKERLREKSRSADDPIRVQVKLVEKSDPGNVATLSYTDAFSVFRYQVMGPPDEIAHLATLGVPIPSDGSAPEIQVLHWSVHNDGSGPRMTRIASDPVGTTREMTLLPIEAHPQGESLGTMARFDDFNDFLSPLFLAQDLMNERSF